MVKFFRTVPHAIAYKQLKKLRQVHAMSAVVISSALESNHIVDMGLQSGSRHGPTRMNQSKREILIHYVPIKPLPA